MRMHTHTETTYPRARLDALFDGIMAVAMTLLVLDIRLPEEFHPQTNQQLLNGLLALWPKVFPYLMSFFVLGSRWLDMVALRSRTELHQGAYIRWWLFYLLQITCLPFTTIVLGRHGNLPAAVWLYLFNTTLIAMAAWKMLQLTPQLEIEQLRHERKLRLGLLLLSVAACFAWSFWDSASSLWWLALNALPLRYLPLIARKSPSN